GQALFEHLQVGMRITAVFEALGLTGEQRLALLGAVVSIGRIEEKRFRRLAKIADQPAAMDQFGGRFPAGGRLLLFHVFSMKIILLPMKRNITQCFSWCNSQCREKIPYALPSPGMARGSR